MCTSVHPLAMEKVLNGSGNKKDANDVFLKKKRRSSERSAYNADVHNVSHEFCNVLDLSN